ncbi:MAG: class I SAM-dependent methyltransferase [Pseudomonadota bacterium]
MFAALEEQLPAPAVALDCATGSGQLAIGLAGFCERVIATDASAEQIEQAMPHPRVSYRVAAAEQSGLPAASVDLMTVGQALHWFDHARFAAEASRVIREGGLLVCASYAVCEITPDIDRIVDRLYTDLLDPFWPPERGMVENGYADIALPGTPLALPRLAMSETWSVADMLGYLRTWSASKRYQRRHRADPVGLIAAELENAWGAGTRKVSWPLTVRASRLGVR